MTYEFECENVVAGCGSKVSGDTEEDVVEAAARHAREVHGMIELPDELVGRVLASIRPAE